MLVHRILLWSSLFGLLFVLLGSASARTAEPVIQTVSGSVLDGITQRPISNATITFINGTAKIAAVTGSDGTFTVSLPTGTYQVVAMSKGFEIARRSAIVINDRAITLQITLYAIGTLKTIANVSVGLPASGINVTPAAVNSLTSQQIAAQGSIGLSRVLSEIPGVQITMAAPGTEGSAFADEYAVNSPANPIYIGIRGSQPYENATLYDGHRINSTDWTEALSAGTHGDAGVFNLAMLDTNSISSLDVVKGPGADSPTINNAIGGVANIVPLTPSGPPSVRFGYGFDGSGGLKFNIVGEGESRNKRLGLAVTATSDTVSGPIGGFPLFGFALSTFGFGLINGNELIATYQYPGYNPYSYAPHLYGGYYNQTAPVIACCLTKFTQDTSNIQQRSVSLLYNLAPTVQITLRYALNNSLNNFLCTPVLQIFNPPAGYTGKYPNNYQFYESTGHTGVITPSREVDQTYEWDVHSQLGKGSLRLSYLSYSSANTNNGGRSGNIVCSPCTISGEVLVGGAFDLNTFTTTGVPTVLNDQNVGSITPAVSQLENTFSRSLSHDIIADLVYPIGNGTTAELSYNSTVTSGFTDDLSISSYSPQFFAGSGVAPTQIFNSILGFGQFERFSSIRGSLHGMLTRTLAADASFYINRYQYHIPNPANPYQTQTIGCCTFLTTDARNLTDFYSSFSTPRFGFEWRPRGDLAIRASAGSAISPIDVSNLLGQNQIPTPNAAPPTFYCVSLPNRNLKAETSFGEDLGASLRLGRFGTLSTDIYNTTLHGQFFTNLQPNGMYLGLPLYASQTRNLAHSRYEGFEFTFENRPPAGLFWSLQGSLQRGFAYDVPQSFYTSQAGPYTTNLTIIQNTNFDGGQNGIGRVAYAQGYAVLGWENARGFQISSNFTYYGNYNGFYRPAFITIDLDGNIPLTNRVSLSLALANLTNIYPSLYYRAGEFAVIPYVHVDPFGYIGQTNTVQNVGPRHLSGALNFRL